MKNTKKKNGAAKGKGRAALSAQQTIPYLSMHPDGVCKLPGGLYTKTVEYEDINYSVASTEDQTAIFSGWSSFLNYFDSSLPFQLSFTMTTINLKDFYYWYTQDQLIEVSDEVAEVFKADARYEMAYQRRLSRHKAQYSLDCDDGIEYSACLHEPTPQELLERMETFLRLWNALNSLPEIQGRRIDAHIILGKSIKEIAEAEGVHEESIRQSIKRGLERMKKTF